MSVSVRGTSPASRERYGTTMNELGVVLVPLASAALLAAIPGYRISARLNVLASLISLLFAISLLFGALFGAAVLGWGAGWIGSLTGQTM